MAKGRIGLDLGSTAVRAAELSGGPQPVVLRAAQVPLPEGAIESGEVRDTTRWPTPCASCGSVAASSRDRSGWAWGTSGSSSARSPCPSSRRRSSARRSSLQVQEYIPMSVDEAVLDYDPIGEFDQDDRKMLRVLLVAAQRVMVDQFVTAVQSAKLEPMGLDLVPFALVRAIGTADVAMDLEERAKKPSSTWVPTSRTSCVHARGNTRFVRVLPSGGRDVTLAIARAAGIEDDVAERLKRGEEVEGGAARRRDPRHRPARGPRRSWTRSDPRSSSTRRRRGTRASARSWSRGRLQARRSHRPDAPSGSRSPSTPARCSNTCPHSCPCRPRRPRTLSPSSRWRSASRSRRGPDEPGQPPPPEISRARSTAARPWRSSSAASCCWSSSSRSICSRSSGCRRSRMRSRPGAHEREPPGTDQRAPGVRRPQDPGRADRGGARPGLSERGLVLRPPARHVAHHAERRLPPELHGHDHDGRGRAGRGDGDRRDVHRYAIVGRPSDRRRHGQPVPDPLGAGQG